MKRLQMTAVVCLALVLVGFGAATLIAQDRSKPGESGVTKEKPRQSESMAGSDRREIEHVLHAYLDGLSGKDNPKTAAILYADGHSYWASGQPLQVRSREITARRKTFEKSKESAKDPSYWKASDQKIELVDVTGPAAVAKVSWVSTVTKGTSFKLTTYLLLNRASTGWVIVADSNIGDWQN